MTCVLGDGWEGLAAQAPFDAINVAAATGDAPPGALEDQLATGGRLVAPVGRRKQYLVRVRRTELGVVRERFDPVRFVPLVRGEAGRAPEDAPPDRPLPEDRPPPR